VYLEMEEKAKAVEEVDKALALDPEHPEARGLRSEIAPPLTLR
jgi:Tfp pilus assembly protein PilF